MTPPAPRCEHLGACPVCGSSASRERFVSPDLALSVPGSFRYVECVGCRSVYQDPRVRARDIPLCYPSGYFTHESNPAWTPRPAPPGSFRDLVKRGVRHSADGVPDEGLPAPFRLAGRLLALHAGLRRRARLGLIDGLAPPVDRTGRCLEVGPGSGLDLFRLSSLGWDACGLEADPVAAQRARERSGCEVRVGTLASMDYPAGRFDLVYMSHVVEHLPDLGSSLRRCRDLLAPGGRLVAVYPNPAALSARLYGRLSIVWDPPRHLVLPAPGAFASLLRGAGFSEVRARTTAEHARQYSAASRAQSRGGRWDWSRPGPAARRDGLFALLEAAFVALGVPRGEEVVVWAFPDGRERGGRSTRS